jgi:hypothetical protein
MTKRRRRSFKRELREYEDHCRMMASKYSASVRRADNNYWQHRADTLRAEALAMLSKADEYEAKQVSNQADKAANKKQCTAWLRYAGVCKLILQMPAQQSRVFTQLLPKAAIKYFLLVAEGKLDEAARHVDAALREATRMR